MRLKELRPKPSVNVILVIIFYLLLNFKSTIAEHLALYTIMEQDGKVIIIAIISRIIFTLICASNIIIISCEIQQLDYIKVRVANGLIRN